MPLEPSGDKFTANVKVVHDPVKALSPEATALLAETSQDRNGTLLMVETLAGLGVETNEKDFVPEGDPRSAAIYRDAVRELVEAEFLRSVGAKGEIFEITRAGYSAAETARAAGS